jgi:hypothetical protein
LKITRTALGPRSPETPDGSLGGITKPHRRPNDDVVEMAIAIQVNRNRVRMFVVVVKGPLELIFPSELRAGDAMAIAETTDDGAVK